MKTKTKKLIGSLAILFLGGVVGNAQTTPEGRVGLAQDWSHRHVQYSNTVTLPQRMNVLKDPRVLHNLLDRSWRPNFPKANGGARFMNEEPGRSLTPGYDAPATSPFADVATRFWRPIPIPVRTKNKNSEIDWAVSLGTGGQFPTGETPAKYQFDVTKPPDCANDFVVFPVNATPSATQANLVAINNIYSGTNPTGQCGTAPTVMWSYKLGSAGIALSPALSLDGKKVAVIETGTRAIFHVLTWTAGQGTSAIAPNTTPNEHTLDYTTIGATGCTNAAASDSNSSPYIDYDGDGAFIAADNGILYHVKNVFGGTPTLDFCTLISGNTALTSPVYDSGAKKVFISDGASVFSVDFSSTTGFSNRKSIPVAGAGGIILSPIIDGSSNMIYVFSASNIAGTNSIVSQIPYSLASHTDVNIGAAANGYILDGAFDINFYFSSNPTTWTLYACGRTATNGSRPALYGITFAANGVMNTAPLFSANATINPGNANGACSPLRTFYNGGVDRLFVSTTGSNTVSMYNITNRLNATSTAAATAANYSGGTGSFSVDNTSTAPQASSIYFGTMGSSTTTCPTTGAPTSLSVQTAGNSAAASSQTLAVTIPTTRVGDLIVVAAGAATSSRTMSGVTDNATGGADTFTHATGARFTATNLFTDVYYALKTTRSGATTVTVTYSNNVSNRVAVVWVVRGFNNAAVDVVNGVTNGSASSGTATGGSVTTTSTAQEFVASLINASGTVTANPKAGNEFTSGGIITGGDAGASLITSSPAAHQPAWTVSGGGAFASTTIAFRDNTATATANYCAVKLTQSALQ